LQSQNSLIEGEESFRTALERFRIFLGLPENVHIEVEEAAPSFVEVDYDVDSAVEVAMKNRLDVLNRTEQLQDVERSLRIARNGLLPDLNLDLSYGNAVDTAPAFDRSDIDNGSWSVGLTLGLPVDRLSERNAYRSAQIAYGRAKRDYERFLQELAVEIRSTFRGLVRGKQSLEIQRQLIEDQERNAKIAQIRLERGEVSNREVIDAQESLLEARNGLIQDQVDYEIARLTLLRDLGILFIDEHGMWTQ
jgi:outer membrane protein TolC